MTELTFVNTFFNAMPATVFPALYTELKDAASLECPEQPNGFLGYQTIYADQDFARLFAVDGVVPERAEIPTLPPLGANPTVAQRDIFKLNKEIFSAYCAADSRLKRALIKAIGISAQTAIGHPRFGLQRMTTRHIVQALFNRYGILSPPEIDAILLKVVAPFTSATLLDEEASSRSRMYGLLADANQEIPEYLKVQHFKHSVENLPGAADLLRQYLISHPETVQRTYFSIQQYFQRHLTPPLTTAAAGYTGAATAVPTVPPPIGSAPDLALQAWLDTRIAAAVASVTAPAAKAKAKPTAKSATCYCFVHGYRSSHSGTDCRVMASQSALYPAAARNARSHDQAGIPANASTTRR